MPNDCINVMPSHFNLKLNLKATSLSSTFFNKVSRLHQGLHKEVFIFKNIIELLINSKV